MRLRSVVVRYLAGFREHWRRIFVTLIAFFAVSFAGPWLLDTAIAPLLAIALLLVGTGVVARATVKRDFHWTGVGVSLTSAGIVLLAFTGVGPW